MDKLELLLDMIEYPDRYTDEQLQQLLADEDVKKEYDVMVRLREAYSDNSKLKIHNSKLAAQGSEESKHTAPAHNYELCIMNYALKKIAAIFLAAAFLGGLAWAIVPLIMPRGNQTSQVSTPLSSGEGMEVRLDGGELISFADIRLDSMLTTVAAHYGKTVFFGNEELKGLHVHTKWNPKDSLEAFLESLNELDGLKLTEQRDTIFVQKGGVQ